MSTRTRRCQFSILGMVLTVSAIAVALGCLAEMRRIKLTQRFFRLQAASCAQSMQNEIDLQSFLLKSALNSEHQAERIKQRIPSKDPVDRFFPPPQEHRERIASLMAWEMSTYTRLRHSRRQCLAMAVQAKIRAESYAALRRKYEQAADRLWLPFMSNPLDRTPSVAAPPR